MSEFDAVQVAAIAAVGLAAGVLGGMTGIGGSLIMIPALVYMYGQGQVKPGVFGFREFFDQHLYQAAAMAVNVAVSGAATWRHAQAGAVVKPVLRWMMPAAVVMVLVGVAVSNLPVFRGGQGPIWLGRILAVFLVYVMAVNIRRLMVRSDGPDSVADPISNGATGVEGGPGEREAASGSASHGVVRPGVVGASMGFIGGLLGIGGGAIAVPLQQMLLGLNLRSAIANSAAVMCVSAAIGAAYKMMSLPGESVAAAGTMALLLAPTAIAGGWIGGRLTHAAPVAWVRAVWIVVLVASTWKMAGL